MFPFDNSINETINNDIDTEIFAIVNLVNNSKWKYCYIHCEKKDFYDEMKLIVSNNPSNDLIRIIIMTEIPDISVDFWELFVSSFKEIYNKEYTIVINDLPKSFLDCSRNYFNIKRKHLGLPNIELTDYILFSIVKDVKNNIEKGMK